MGHLGMSKGPELICIDNLIRVCGYFHDHAIDPSKITSEAVKSAKALSMSHFMTTYVSCNESLPTSPSNHPHP